MLVDHVIVASLRQYVSRNQSIPAFHEEISQNPDAFSLRLDSLQSAIENGILYADVFRDPDCTTLLLYLMETKRVSATLGVSTYFHCLALMEFTEKQPLRDCDADLKMITRFKNLCLVKNAALTQDAELFVRGVIENFSKLAIHINEDQFREDILDLSKVDQWVNVICMPTKDELNSKRLSFNRGVLENISFIVKCKHWRGAPPDHITYLVPSFGIMMYCLSLISSNPVAPKCVLGSVSVDTLYALHQRNEHPVSLYHPLVASNLKLVHGVRSGVYLAALHDMGHVFWASLFTNDERKLILNNFLQFINALSDEAEAHRDELAKARLDQIKFKSYDFDLTPLVNYHEPKFRLAEYIQSCFGNGGQGVFGIYCKSDYKSAPIGTIESDHVFYLVCRQYHLKRDPYQIAYCLRVLALKKDRYFRDDGIISLIDSLASHVAKSSAPLALFDASYKNERLNIDYAAIHALLLQDLDSPTLWVTLRDHHHADLLVLLRSLKLAYFEPYVPLSAADRAKLKAHVEWHHANTPVAVVEAAEQACGVL